MCVCAACSDPSTKRWLVRHVDAVFGFPSVVRFSWATARLLLKAKAYQVTWYDALDEDEAGNDHHGGADTDKRTRRLEHFMDAACSNSSSASQAAAGTSSSVIASRERFHYFQQRHLDVVTAFA